MSQRNKFLMKMKIRKIKKEMNKHQIIRKNKPFPKNPESAFSETALTPKPTPQILLAA